MIIMLYVCLPISSENMEKLQSIAHKLLPSKIKLFDLLNPNLRLDRPSEKLPHWMSHEQLSPNPLPVVGATESCTPKQPQHKKSFPPQAITLMNSSTT